MKPPLRPDDEVRRLAALRRFHLLDTLPEQALDDLTALAAHICGAPISLISLVDEKRQWFKSKIGLAASETPRDVSFCAHALHQAEIFIVPDATTDDRFADNPLVTGDPGIRFYAGAPLLTPEGQALGTLCVIDRVPRQLTEFQEQALRVLSRQVMAQLEFRRQTRELAARERLLQGIFDSEPECVKLAGPDGSLRMMNRAGLQMIEADSFEEVAGRSIYSLIVPEDRAKFEALSARVFRGESGTAEFQIVGMKGARCWLETNATPLRDERGEVTALLGIARDVTERRQTEESLRESERRMNTLFNASPAAICVNTVDAGRVIDINEQFIRFTGFAREELIGRTVFDLKLWADPETRQPVMSRLKTDGAVRGVEAQFRRKNGEVRDVLVSCELVELTGESAPVTISMFLDVTERKRTEATLASTSETLAAVTEALAAYVERGDWKAAMGRLLRCAIDQTQSEYGFIGVVVDSTLRVLAHEGIVWDKIINRDFYEQALRSYEKLGYLEFTSFNNLFGRAITTGQVVIANMPDSDPRSGGRPSGHPPMRSFLGVPIFVGEQVQGMVALANRPGGYSEDEQRRIETLVQHAGGLCRSYRQREAEIVLEQERAKVEAALAKAEGNRRAVWQSSIDAIIAMDESGNITDFNPAAEKTFGYRAADVIGQSLADKIIPTALRDGHRRGMARFLATGQGAIMGRSVELSALRSDGTEFPMELTVVNVTRADRPTFLGTVRDITERKRAEEALRASEANMAAAQRISHFGSWELDLANRDYSSAIALRWSDEMFRIAGYEPGGVQITRELFFGIVHPEDREPVRQAVAKAIQERGTYSIVHRFIMPDGAVRRVQQAAQIIFDEQTGQPLKMVGTTHDITERERGERQLAALVTLGRRLGGAATAVEAARIIVETADDLFGWDSCWLHLYDKVTDRFSSVLNMDVVDGRREDVPSTYADQPPSPFARRAISEGPQLILHERPAVGVSDRIPFGDTARPSASVMIVPVRHGEELIAVLSIQSYTVNAYRQENLVALEAMADQCGGALVQIRAREALRESEDRFRQVVESIHEVFWVTDPTKNEILYLSPAYESIWGRTCASLYASPRAWLEAIHPDDRSRIAQAAETKQVRGDYDEIYRILRPDGSVRWIRDRAFPVRNEAGEIHRVVGTAEDITGRKNAESLALRSQRLESIGTLAGGVAHDLNNALAPIMMGVELLRMQYPQESQILDMFQSSAKRGADMVRQLLSFAKGAEGERVALQPTRLIRDLEKMMKGSFPKNIQLVIRCDPKLPMILGDATQLDQVLLNLCVNARDAMPHGGTLTLEGQRVEVDAAFASSIPEAMPGNYVVVRVRDTGTGIPPEIIDRIFDPFFTTKGPDQGTGLGLSTVMGIVKGHGGFLQVSSQPDQGSTFAAYLPAESVGDSTEDTTKPAQAFRGQGELILFVDDEAAVRETARAVLQRLNFRVVTATDGLNGVMQLAEHRTELRAIVTDLHMPHMDGLNFVRSLRRMLPDIPIVVASGRMDVLMAEEFKTLGVTSRLDKPFTEGQLAEALEKLLAPK